MTAQFRQRGRSARASEVSNLSGGGCRAGLDDVLLVDAGWVKLPTIESLAASIVWHAGAEIGLKFERELHPAVFRTLVERHSR